MKNYLCYYNGKYLPYSEIQLPVSDLALQRGYGIFDYFRIRNGKAFMMNDHLDRFELAYQTLRLNPGISQEEIGYTVENLIKRNAQTEGAVRLIITGGSLAIEGDFPFPNLIILTEDFQVFDAALYSEGASLLLTEHLRFLPHVKTINYAPYFYLSKKMHSFGAVDILYHQSGKVFETTRSNFYIVKDNCIITPKEQMLYGITRKILLKLAEERVKLIERELLLREVYEADEAFISSSSKEVMPVVEIEGNRIGNGKVGAITQLMMKLFRDYVMENF